MSPKPPSQPGTDVEGAHRALEVLWVALRLGLTSFGGPIAHLGYFERTYVRQRQWLTARDYAQLLALCQIIPGPASSQLGFLIGLRRAGYWGALAAWIGFTLPSVVCLFVGARLTARWHGAVAESVLHGLTLVAVAVVTQAVWSLGRRLWTDALAITVGIVAGIAVLYWTSAGGTVGVLVAAALVGAMVCRERGSAGVTPSALVGRRVAWAATIAYLLLLVGLPLFAAPSGHGAIDLAATFYRAGALVFGGGHVVLPMLRSALVPAGWLPERTFLVGYGLAQAVPGPLFSVAAYLGSANAFVGPPILAAGIAVLSIFLPGLLLALAAVALWTQFGAHARVRGALVGVNAAVVGILGAALCRPVLTTSVRSIADVLIAAIAIALLERWRLPPLVVVVFCVAGSVLESWPG